MPILKSFEYDEYGQMYTVDFYDESHINIRNDGQGRWLLTVIDLKLNKDNAPAILEMIELIKEKMNEG